MSLRTLSDHVADICQNSTKAGASHVKLKVDESDDAFFFEVQDDAGGMSKEILARIYDPFYTSRDKKIRKVGLGIPFLKSAAEQTGGWLEIVSEEGKGTKLSVRFDKSHIDCQPVGDLAGTFFTLITADQAIRWEIHRTYNEDEYDIDTETLFENQADKKLWENPSFLKIIRESLYEMEKSIKD
ncbi:MAG TPA: ATP-binding protein [Thermotogota bacterium]|nr:ATP-binding protein [Thermotogota bacterium]